MLTYYDGMYVCLRLNEMKEVSFECIGYSIKVRDPARHGPTGNRSRLCEANTFFISGPNELKLRI